MQIGDINLIWTGHAGFFISNAKNIYIDPYKLSPGSGDVSKKADIILLTHSHYDHCSIEDLRRIVKDNCIVICSGDCCSKFSHLDEKIDLRVIEPGQRIQLDGVKVIAVPAYNLNKSFHSKKEYWVGYIVEIEGLRIYHAGDTDLIPEMGKLGKIDIALLPVGGTYTMNAEEAAKAVMKIKPKKAVPMHYGDVVGTREDAERFVDLCQGEGIDAEVMEKN